MTKKPDVMHRTTIYLSQGQKRFLDKEAKRQGLKAAQVLRTILSKAIQESE
jgi:hypothetical protein